MIRELTRHEGASADLSLVTTITAAFLRLQPVSYQLLCMDADGMCVMDLMRSSWPETSTATDMDF